MQTKHDILVVGSGIAGLSFALKAAELLPQKSIALFTKGQLTESNSFYTQGGIAAVTNTIIDSFESHIQDTLKSGGGLCDPAIVRFVVENAPSRIEELVQIGVAFSRTKTGKFDLALEGGHQFHRVVRADDNTGEHVIKALIRKVKDTKQIKLYENHVAIELLKSNNGNVAGLVLLNSISKQIRTFSSSKIILATGGCGQVYENTTNPSIATGDGIALGIQAGAMTSNMSYFQFHPTALYSKNLKQLSLLTEALRGFGAHIVNNEGKRFLFDCDSRGELATRDIVSTAIFKELKKTGRECVYLSCEHLDFDAIKQRFPTIYSNLLQHQIDIRNQKIPIVPAAHYLCGGLKVNECGQTNIEGLYAIGECAETGLHGKNRLASNSLLEALVFANEAAKFVAFSIDNPSDLTLLSTKNYRLNDELDKQFKELIKTCKSCMTKFVTIASSEEDTQYAFQEIQKLKLAFEQLDTHQEVSTIKLEAKSIISVAAQIIEHKRSNQSLKKFISKSEDFIPN